MDKLNGEIPTQSKANIMLKLESKFKKLVANNKLRQALDEVIELIEKFEKVHAPLDADESKIQHHTILLSSRLHALEDRPDGTNNNKEYDSEKNSIAIGFLKNFQEVIALPRLKDFLESIEEEEDIWQQAVSKNSIESFNIYINKYPNGKYKAEALRHKKFLEKKDEENKFWQKTIIENTIEGFNLYIKTYPDGEHLFDAQRFIKEKDEEIRKLKIQEAEEKRKVEEDERKKKEEQEAEIIRLEHEAVEKTRKNDFITAVNIAHQSFANGQWQESSSFFKKALALYKEGDTPASDSLRQGLLNCTNENTIEVHIQNAQNLIELHEYKEALNHINKALKIRPSEVKAIQLKNEIISLGTKKINYPSWKNIAIVLISLAFLIFLGKRCQTQSVKSNANSTWLDSLPSRKNVLAEIRKRNEIRIVVESEAEPFNYKDENGKDAGFDYEIAKFIAKELGIANVKMLHMSSDELDYSEFPAAFNRNIGDCFMGGYVKNMHFDHLVSWSDSYFDENGLSLIVKKGTSFNNNTDLKTALKGKKIAVYDDPLAIKFVEDELGAIAKPCIDTSDNQLWIKKELDTLGMDAVIYDYPFAMSEILGFDPSCEQYEIVQYNLYNMPYVIGIPKGNDDLLREINIAIRSLIRNEELYKSIIEKNIPKPICVPPVDKRFPKKCIHVVEKGETFSGIVKKELGWNPLRWPEVYEWNKKRIPNPHLIHPGNEIQICPISSSLEASNIK